ncbi:hypothetical protein D3C71_1144080 [compost metagenome]
MKSLKIGLNTELVPVRIHIFLSEFGWLLGSNFSQNSRSKLFGLRNKLRFDKCPACLNCLAVELVIIQMAQGQGVPLLNTCSMIANNRAAVNTHVPMNPAVA